MWVAAVTEPATQGEQNEQFQFLVDRFPQYSFSIMMGKEPYIICKPADDTIQHPGDDIHRLEDEVAILRFMVTMLIDDQITGQVITDGL